MDSHKPLLSFCLVAYNQAAFIRDAVEAALSQTYSPLEIILSDDCSSDVTFEIIREVASAYSGPHLVRVNRTARNCGLCQHVNQVAELARGELIIVAAGDDISLPERSQLTLEAWEDSGRLATSIWG